MFHDERMILTPHLMAILGGYLEKVIFRERELLLVKEGAYLWGVDFLDTGKGIFNHVCLVARKAYLLTMLLKNKSITRNDGKYENLCPGMSAILGLTHDLIKLHSGTNPKRDNCTWIAGREDLTTDEKLALGLPAEYQESHPLAGEIASDWAKKYFPQNTADELISIINKEGINKNIYQKIILFCDYSVGQCMQTTRQRCNDIVSRWIKPYITNWEIFNGDNIEILLYNANQLVWDKSNPPRIKPETRANTVNNALILAKEFTDYLDLSEEELNSNSELKENYAFEWEKILRDLWLKDYEYQKQHDGKGTPFSDKYKSLN